MVYVGDCLDTDCFGAARAGLHGDWLNRRGIDDDTGSSRYTLDSVPKEVFWFVEREKACRDMTTDNIFLGKSTMRSVRHEGHKERHHEGRYWNRNR